MWVPGHVHTLGLAKDPRDTTWLTQEPGSLNLKAGVSQVGGGEGNVEGKSLRVAKMKMGNSRALMEAEREVRGAEKPEDHSRWDLHVATPGSFGQAVSMFHSHPQCSEQSPGYPLATAVPLGPRKPPL